MDDVPKTKRRVMRGAALMDRVRPGWFKRVKITKLDMAVGSRTPDGCGCILAQENEHYDPWDVGLTFNDAAEFGFTAKRGFHRNSAEFRQLTRDWQDAIRKRRAKA